MPPDDDIRASDDYTYNELTNEEKEWLRRNGYQPGELSAKEVRQLMEADRDTDADNIGVIGDEMDGTDADAS